MKKGEWGVFSFFWGLNWRDFGRAGKFPQIYFCRFDEIEVISQ